jgi:PhnB protein
MASLSPQGEPHAHADRTLHQDAARAKRVFEALAVGGQVQMPFAKTFWAEGFGMLTDKFGVPWMVNCLA